MAKKVIHVNRQFIAFNAKLGKPVLPCYIIREGSKPGVYGFAFKAKGTVEGIDPRKRPPLKCGARAWLETNSEVEVIGAMDFKKADALRKKYRKQLEGK